MLYAGPLVLTGMPTKRGAKKHVKGAIVDAVGFWHKRFARSHFTASAYSKYSYEKRTMKYARRKQREKGHSLPIVWTGATRTLVTSFIRKTGTSKVATGTMFAPFYVSQKVRRGRKGPLLGDELTRMAPAEITRIARFLSKNIVRRMNRDTTKRKARAT